MAGRNQGLTQSQSQDSTIEDQRFAELLKPIKDLTQNWEVPLAEIMSQYMDVLQQVKLKLLSRKPTLNHGCIKCPKNLNFPQTIKKFGKK